MKKILFLFGLLLLAVAVIAQPGVDTTGLDGWNPFDGDLTVDKLNDVFSPIYGAIVIIWGYVAKALGLKKKNIDFVFVVLAGALVAGGVFLAQGFSAIGIVVSFLASLGIFDLILKPIEKVIGKTKVQAGK